MLPLLGACATGLDAGDAESIARDAVVVDTHIDAPIRIERGTDIDVTVEGGGGQFDLPRAERGGLNVAFMSIFVPAQVDVAGQGVDFADRMIDHVESIVTRAPDRAALVTCVADVMKVKTSGRVGLAMGMENGGPLAAADDTAPHFAARGVRYVTLAHSKSNALSDSSYDRERPWGGLSDRGRAMVRQLNDLGVMIDVSHLSDDAFWDVLETSAVPVIASHSAARQFIPDFERNMSDDMMRALAVAGGVMQINFGGSFVSAEAHAWQERSQEVLRRFTAESGAAPDSQAVRAFRDEYLAANPYPRPTLALVLDHIDHAVRIAGIDHVGLGSDFDGVGDTLPTGIGDVSAYPNLVRGLIERGYERAAIEAILGGNLLRVWRAAEAYGAQHNGPVRCAQ